MTSAAMILAFSAGAALLVLALRMRGAGSGPDLLGAPRRRKRILKGDAERLRDLVADGREEEALRMARDRGFTDEEGRTLVRLAAALQAPCDGD